MTRINQQRISVKRRPIIAPRPAPAQAPVQAPVLAPAIERRGPMIAPRPAQANMNKIGGTRRKYRRRKHHRCHTKKLKKRTV